MLAIHPEQMTAFRNAALHAFKDEMLLHLKEFAAPLFESVGEAGMREAIDLGVSRAASYGFTFRGPVRLYLELMMILGSHFDTDPQYPWAKEILLANKAGSQMQRADALYKQSTDYLEKVAGPSDSYALEALRKISVFFLLRPAFSRDNLSADISNTIAQIYPQKADYVGRMGLETLIGKSLNGAKRQGFETDTGIGLVVMLLFVLGHGCGIDPVYPWVREIFNNPINNTPELRATVLQARFNAWLNIRLNATVPVILP